MSLLWLIPIIFAVMFGGTYMVMAYSESQREKAMQEWRRKWH